MNAIAKEARVRVWVYPEREWRNLGEVSWLVSWHELRPGVKREGDEIDLDSDLIERAHRCVTEEQAKEFGKLAYETKPLFFGAVYIQKQVVDWFVEEDRVAEWRDVGEEISA
jgi:hypothetical protein